jgi:hypothetical protein
MNLKVTFTLHRGLELWKVPSRKVIAVSKESIREKRRFRNPDPETTVGYESIQKCLCSIQKVYNRYVARCGYKTQGRLHQTP